MKTNENTEKFTSCKTDWCPGCGNFPILNVMATVLNELELNPSDVLLVGGIGQAAKTNQYLNANGFSGLHGRALSAAVGAKIVNPKLTVIVNTGEGDSYGEGGNHFIHNIRRNVDITHLVHNNQIYGLTKGQPSPTSDDCIISEENLSCNNSIPFNPMTIAIATGATFVARAFSGDRQHLNYVIKEAIKHEGYALVDILQPCVVFNKVNTYEFYRNLIYKLDDDYDNTNKLHALEKSMEFNNQIPIGIIYKSNAITYHQRNQLPNIKYEETNTKLQEILSSLT